MNTSPATFFRQALSGLLASACLLTSATGLAQSPTLGDRPFAWVGDHPLPTSQLHSAFNSLLRKKYYHGTVPEGEMQAVMKEAQDEVINAYLLAQEVDRQKVEPDTVRVESEIARYEAQYKDSLQWQQNRESLLPGLRSEIQRRSRLEQLEKKVRDISVSEEEVKKYYEARKELFTEPEKLRLHAILLSVDPSSPPQAWELAKKEAESIVKRLRQGADFEESAKMHSQDSSSSKGGDMGYLHRGMIPEELQSSIDKMKLNEISDPVAVLEGITIIRLTDRTQSKLRSYAEVAERARGLLLREQQDATWKKFLEELRIKSKVRLIEQPPPAQPR